MYLYSTDYFQNCEKLWSTHRPNQQPFTPEFTPIVNLVWTFNSLLYVKTVENLHKKTKTNKKKTTDHQESNVWPSCCKTNLPTIPIYILGYRLCFLNCLASYHLWPQEGTFYTWTLLLHHRNNYNPKPSQTSIKHWTPHTTPWKMLLRRPENYYIFTANNLCQRSSRNSVAGGDCDYLKKKLPLAVMMMNGFKDVE